MRAATRGSSAKSSRSEEHTSELQSLRTTSYAVFCLKKKKNGFSFRARLDSLGREQQVSLRQLLVRQDARLRVFVRLDQHHDPHRLLFFWIGAPPSSTRYETLFPYTTLFR